VSDVVKPVNDKGTQKRDEFINRVVDFIKTTVSAPDVGDLFVYLGIAYVSYDKFHSIIGDIPSLLYGPVAVKLATTPTYGGGAGVKILGSGIEIPVNSQVCGMAMLSVLGLALLPWKELMDFLRGSIENAEKLVSGVQLADQFIASQDFQYINPITERPQFEIRLASARLTARFQILGLEQKVTGEEDADVFRAYVQSLWDACNARNPSRVPSGGGAR